MIYFIYSHAFSDVFSIDADFPQAESKIQRCILDTVQVIPCLLLFLVVTSLGLFSYIFLFALKKIAFINISFIFSVYMYIYIALLFRYSFTKSNIFFNETCYYLLDYLGRVSFAHVSPFLVLWWILMYILYIVQPYPSFDAWFSLYCIFFCSFRFSI